METTNKQFFDNGRGDEEAQGHKEMGQNGGVTEEWSPQRQDMPDGCDDMTALYCGQDLCLENLSCITAPVVKHAEKKPDVFLTQFLLK